MQNQPPKAANPPPLTDTMKLRNSTFGSKYQRKAARVEILPLIDVMFLLVAFFMVISMSMIVQKGINVDLSPAETGESTTQDTESVVLSVNVAGEIFLNREPISKTDLNKALNRYATHDPARAVVLNADKGATHGNVISILDLVRKSGLHNVIFSVGPDE